jgi:hypothetical protein
VRVGIAHHLGWAVVVAASDDGSVADRRRIELVEPGLPTPRDQQAGPTGVSVYDSAPDPAAPEIDPPPCPIIVPGRFGPSGKVIV